MALQVDEADFNFRLRVAERKTGIGIGAGASAIDHVFEYVTRHLNGTGANKVGAVYSNRGTIVNGVPLDLDLRGTLVSVLDGSVVNFPIITGIFVSNLSTTTLHGLTIGAGANPFISWLIATGDGLKVGAGGMFALYAPIDGYATTIATADILRITSDVGSTDADILILGRAS